MIISRIWDFDDLGGGFSRLRWDFEVCVRTFNQISRSVAFIKIKDFREDFSEIMVTLFNISGSFLIEPYF